MSRETIHGEPVQSRRSFLKLASGTAAAAVGLATFGQKTAHAVESGAVTDWDYEADVVVVGYGGAGSIAAIAAGDDGADVLVLEAAPIEGGGTTRMSGAYFVSSEDSDAAAEYLKCQCQGASSDDVIEAWAVGITQNRDWLSSHGIPWAPSNRGHVLSNPPGGLRNEPFDGSDYPNLPHADAIDTNEIVGRGNMLYQFTNSIVEGMSNVEVLFDTRGIDLVQDGASREIHGVKALQGENEVYVKARRGVILATGGFSHNPDLVRRFLRPDSGYVSLETPYNLGDGLKMAMKAGAALTHMTFACGTWPTFKTSASEIAWMNKIDSSLKAKNWLWTNAVGDRWTCETPMANPHRQWLMYGDIDWTQSANNTGYVDIPNWLIFDETVRLAGPLVPDTYTDGLTTIPVEIGGAPEPWSEDNSKEIEEGIILKGDTLEDLVDAINASDEDGARVEKDRLISAVERFNSFAKSGVDEDFGRAKEEMAPISTPPYYAIKLSPALYGTSGGPEKNGKGQVLDPDGNPIPHLFACGTVSHTQSHLYTTFGANICENFTFGRIAGQAAAATEPWE